MTGQQANYILSTQSIFRLCVCVNFSLARRRKTVNKDGLSLPEFFGKWHNKRYELYCSLVQKTFIYTATLAISTSYYFFAFCASLSGVFDITVGCSRMKFRWYVKFTESFCRWGLLASEVFLLDIVDFMVHSHAHFRELYQLLYVSVVFYYNVIRFTVSDR